jgi:phosphoserine aminotransferase
MINFYPGPSKIYPEVKQYFSEGIDVFSMNHRSETFHELFSSFKDTFRSYFNIPSDYEISILSSATEAWEVINQSFNSHSFHHYYNGAFGEKWANYNSLLGNQIEKYTFELNEILPIPKNKEGVICLTHNETSNGTFINNDALIEIKKNNPDALIAIDSTSILGGSTFDFNNTDMCFSSVQKCLGQPPGLAILITSPKIKKFYNQEKKHYNDLKSILTNSEKLETTHTPNTSGIYTLYRSLKNIDSLEVISNKLGERKKKILEVAEQVNLKTLSDIFQITSPTVLAFKLSQLTFKNVNALAEKHNILIGKGYGKYKENSFRIANFPAHSDHDIVALLAFLKSIPC